MSINTLGHEGKSHEIRWAYKVDRDVKENGKCSMDTRSEETRNVSKIQ